MQTPTPTAAAGQPAPTRLLVEPASRCTNGGTRPSSLALVGWLQGLVTTHDWLDAGGPIDATGNLPAGCCWAYTLESPVDDERVRIAYGSVWRAGWMS